MPAGLPGDEMFDAIAQAFLIEAPPDQDLQDEMEALRGCMRKLPERGRLLLRLRFVKDQAYDQIAQTLGGHEDAARRSVARARLALLDCVERALRRQAVGA